MNSTTGEVGVGFAAATEFTPTARLRIEQPAKLKRAGTYHPTEPLRQEREAYLVPLAKDTTWIHLSATH